MPTYKVTTDKGTFKVNLDKEPESQAQLNELVQLHLQGRAADERIAKDKAELESRAAPEAASLTKTAVPQPEVDRISRLVGNIAGEAFGGAEQAANVPTTPTTSPTEIMDRGFEQAMGLLRIPLAPVTGFFKSVGENVAEDTEPYLGKTGGKVAGTAVDLFGNLVAAPAALNKSLGLVSKLPGAQVTLREIGKREVDAIRTSLNPPVPSSELFKEVGKTNPLIKLPRYQKAAEEIAASEARLGKFGWAEPGIASTASRSAEAAVEPVPFDLVQQIRTRIGQNISTARANGDRVNLGANKTLFKQLAKDLESGDMGAFAGPPTAKSVEYKKLQEANKAANREFALDELDDIFDATLGKALEGRKFDSSSFAQALNKIRAMRRPERGEKITLFEKGLGTENLNQIENRLDELRKLKILPPPEGANVGSALINRSVYGSAGVAGTAGTMLGGPAVGAVAGFAGMATGAIAPWAISKAVQSKTGTKILTEVLKKDHELTAKAIAGILAAIKIDDAKTFENFKGTLSNPGVSLEDKITAAEDYDRNKRAASAIKEYIK